VTAVFFSIFIGVLELKVWLSGCYFRPWAGRSGSGRGRL